jgi:hypothetical protein
MPLIRKTVSAVGLLSLASSAAFAQDLPPAVVACAIERQDNARLACFDREVARVIQRAAGVAPTQVAPPPAAPPAPAVATTPPPNVTPKDDDFGVAGELARKRKSEQEKAAPSTAELRAAVTKITKKPYGELVLELDNGQVWEQPERKLSFAIKEGENIRITQGAMGSYFLVADSGATTKIRRIR